MVIAGVCRALVPALGGLNCYAGAVDTSWAMLEALKLLRNWTKLNNAQTTVRYFRTQSAQASSILYLPKYPYPNPPAPIRRSKESSIATNLIIKSVQEYVASGYGVERDKRKIIDNNSIKKKASLLFTPSKNQEPSFVPLEPSGRCRPEGKKKLITIVDPQKVPYPLSSHRVSL